MHNPDNRTAAPPTDEHVQAIAAEMHSWQCVTPEQRYLLRAAVAALPLIAAPPPADWRAVERQLRVSEVADILRVAPSTVRNLIRAGRLTGYSLSPKKGSAIRVPESSVREYLATEIGRSA